MSALWRGILAVPGFTVVAGGGMACMWALGGKFVTRSVESQGHEWDAAHAVESERAGS